MNQIKIKAAQRLAALNLPFQCSQPMTGSPSEASQLEKLSDSVEADMKQSGMGVTYLHSSLHRLSALLNDRSAVQAATVLMARTTAVSKIAERGMRTIVQQLIKEGYHADTSQNKAFYTTVFYKEDHEDPRFEMVGWHGTGRFAGGEKAILEFYDDDKSTQTPVVTIGVLSEENLNPAKQQEVIQHIIEYVRSHG